MYHVSRQNCFLLLRKELLRIAEIWYFVHSSYFLFMHGDSVFTFCRESHFSHTYFWELIDKKNGTKSCHCLLVEVLEDVCMTFC